MPLAAQADAPRVYADANIPCGAVSYMRLRLGWDVFFVMEHEELRRARDIEHYRLARQLGRTLVTQDRDYERDAEFPPSEGAGVIVFVAPDERRLCELLARVDRELFRCAGARPMPLAGRKMRWHIGAAEVLGGPDGASRPTHP
jgi:hypothetical protein